LLTLSLSLSLTTASLTTASLSAYASYVLKRTLTVEKRRESRQPSPLSTSSTKTSSQSK
jgi:hypothetical protein